MIDVLKAQELHSDISLRLHKFCRAHIRFNSTTLMKVWHEEGAEFHRLLIHFQMQPQPNTEIFHAMNQLATVLEVQVYPKAEGHLSCSIRTQSGGRGYLSFDLPW